MSFGLSFNFGQFGGNNTYFNPLEDPTFIPVGDGTTHPFGVPPSVMNDILVNTSSITVTTTSAGTVTTTALTMPTIPNTNIQNKLAAIMDSGNEFSAHTDDSGFSVDLVFGSAALWKQSDGMMYIPATLNYRDNIPADGTGTFINGSGYTICGVCTIWSNYSANIYSPPGQPAPVSINITIQPASYF